MVIAEIPDRTSEVTAFSAASEWTGVRDEDRQAWLELRKTMMTASDIAAILGEDDKRAALDVYVDKVVEQRDEVLAIDDPRFWGSALEQTILRTVARYYGWKYRQGGALLRSRAYPFLGATLDGEVDRGDGRGWLDFEGKTTRIPRGWDEESGQLPTRVLIQVQHQLLVTGAPGAIVFALLQGNIPVQIPIEPSPEFHEIIVREAEAFMVLVARGTPPPPNGTEASGRALQRLYPEADGSAVALPREAIEWTREYQTTSVELKQLEQRKAYFAQLLKNSIGPATYGVLSEDVGGKRCWRWAAPKNSDNRALQALKLAPAGARNVARLPPAGDALVRALTESFSDNDDRDVATVTPIRFGTKRRRSRR